MGMLSSMAKRNQGLGLALTSEAQSQNLFNYCKKVAHSVPEPEHEDGGNEGGDEQTPRHQQVDLPGRKTFKSPKYKLCQKISPDELPPHGGKVKGVTTLNLVPAAAGLAEVKGAVGVPLLLLTTGGREIFVATASVPHLKDFHAESHMFSCFSPPALLQWRLLGLSSCKRSGGNVTFEEFLLQVTLPQQPPKN